MMNISLHQLRLWIAVSSVLGLTLIVKPANADDYVVLVNAANDIKETETNAKRIVKRLFLKEVTDWPNGVTSLPFGRKSSSSAGKAFAAKILQITETEWDTHWLRMKQTNGKTPPRVVGSTRVLLRQIGRKKGAFSYAVADQAGSLPSKVKILFKFSD